MLKVGPYIYKIRTVNPDDETTTVDVSGITFASDWTEAMLNIQNYYRRDLIKVLGITEFEESDCIEISNPEAERIIAEEESFYK